MPQKRSTNTSRSSQSSGRNTSRKSSGSSKKTSTRAQKRSIQPQEEFYDEPLIDQGARNDILGVVIGVLGISLLIAVITPSSALIAKAASDALHMMFGIGAIIVPLVLIIFALTFFIRADRSLPARTGIGLGLIFLAIISIMSLYTPLAAENPQQLFNTTELIDRGGFLGAAIAWAFLKLTGQTIGTIVLLGVILAGFIVIGLSVSSIVEWVTSKVSQPRSYEEWDGRHSYNHERAYLEGGQAQQGSLDLVDECEYCIDEHPSFLERVPFLNRFFEKTYHDDFYGDEYYSEPEVFYDPERTQLITDDDNPEKARTTYIGSRVKTTLLDRAEAMLPSDESLPDDPSPKGRSKKRQAASLKADETGSQAAPKRAKQAPQPGRPTATEGFELPAIDILKVNAAKFKLTPAQENELNATQERLQDTLRVFGMSARVVGWTAGPTVTTFRVAMGDGERVSKLTNLEDDIALSLAASAVRIFSPIPGTSLVGVEIPNNNRSNVTLGDMMPYVKGSPLMLAIGRDVEGNPVTADLAKMPHLLIAGTTGSGKSVMINSILSTILMRATPNEVRLIMVDPKRVELSGYNGIPQLYVPVVTDPRQAASSLQWAVAEMERRLKIFEKAGSRNIASFNTLVQEGKFDDHEQAVEEMPYLVIVIDELTDLMMVAGKDVEASIVRIAQLGRAAGIHLIVATQRPAAEVVTNAIKVNIVNRIAFKVATSVDSRVILGSGGAEKLIGLGDMLYDDGHSMKPSRIQGCFVSDEEITNIVSHLREQGEPDYHEEILSVVLPSTQAGLSGGGAGGSSGDDDPLIWEAAEAVIQMKMGSTSGLQRRLKVGYARAGRIMDMLEEKGIVGPADGTKPREVLVSSEDIETLRAFEQSDAADRDGEF